MTRALLLVDIRSDDFPGATMARVGIAAAVPASLMAALAADAAPCGG